MSLLGSVYRTAAPRDIQTRTTFADQMRELSSKYQNSILHVENTIEYVKRTARESALNGENECFIRLYKDSNDNAHILNKKYALEIESAIRLLGFQDIKIQDGGAIKISW